MSEQLNERQPDAALPEAPASASAKFISPSGVEWLLTSRDFTVSGLLKKIETIEYYLLKKEWTAAGSYNAPASAPGAPLCPVHGVPMKQSQFDQGEWYCSKKTQNGYCTEKIKT